MKCSRPAHAKGIKVQKLCCAVQDNHPNLPKRATIQELQWLSCDDFCRFLGRAGTSMQKHGGFSISMPDGGPAELEPSASVASLKLCRSSRDTLLRPGPRQSGSKVDKV